MTDTPTEVHVCEDVYADESFIADGDARVFGVRPWQNDVGNNPAM